MFRGSHLSYGRVRISIAIHFISSTFTAFTTTFTSSPFFRLNSSRVPKSMSGYAGGFNCGGVSSSTFNVGHKTSLPDPESAKSKEIEPPSIQ